MSDLDNADSWLSRAASSLQRARQAKFNKVSVGTTSIIPTNISKKIRTTKKISS
jgi:hypothetical protein